jgi:hypothetical protein
LDKVEVEVDWKGDSPMTDEERIANLERELAELKAKAEPPEPYKPEKPWPKYDPTEGLRMPASAVKPMVDVVRDPEDQKYNPQAWAQTKVGEPGGFLGPEKKPLEEALTPDKPKSEGPEYLKPERPRGWRNPTPLGPPSGVAIIDQMVDVQDALDKRELQNRLRRL